MFGLGFWEFGVIILLAIVFSEPKEYAKYLRGIGKLSRQFQDFKTQLFREINLLDDIDKKE